MEKAISPKDLLLRSVEQKVVGQIIRKINKCSLSNRQGTIAVFGITHLEFDVPISVLKNYTCEEMTAALLHFKLEGWDISLRDDNKNPIRTYYFHFSCMTHLIRKIGRK